MRELRYESQGTNTYLVYEVKPTDLVDSMSLGMLTNNRISGFAQTIFTQLDSKQYIKFNVSAKTPVSQFFVGAVNRKRLLGVFKGIADAILVAEDYMLDVSSMLLDLDYIFTDVSTCETVVICLPIMNIETPMSGMKNFFRNIIFNTQFDQTENCDYVAAIINYLNSTPSFSMVEFRNLVTSLLNSEGTHSIGGGVQTSPMGDEVQTPPVGGVVQTPATGGEVQTPPAGGVVQTPPVGGVVQTPPVGGVVQTPPVGGVVQTPPVEGGVQIPSIEDGIKSISVEPENKMTMFNLLRNFSKENMELYKAQKAAEKAAPKSEKTKDKKDKAKNVPVSRTGFAIPGQAPETPVAKANISQSASMNVNMSTQQPTVQPQVMQQTPIPQVQVQQPVNQTYTMPAGMNFGETVVLNAGNIGETTVLSQTMNPVQLNPYLIRVKNQEKILMEKPMLRIGKERSFVDYFIVDNTAISRFHAQIVKKEDDYYIIDMNSKNHTFVNGMMINSNLEHKLSHGDKIRLANEDFEFYLR